MYFLKEIKEYHHLAKVVFQHYSKSQKIVIGSFIACMAAILQSAGGFLPGVGYVISPFATFPILLYTFFSLPMGITSYFLTIALLIILQPSELLVFAFTTGFLGLGIGAGFHVFKKRFSIILIGAMMLAVGISSLLYLFHFPILGPVSSNPSLFLTFGMFIFCFLYSWLWIEISLLLLKRVMAIIFS